MRLTNVMVGSLDGEIATKSLETSQERIQHGLSSSADSDHFQREVLHCDAVIIGAETLRTEGSVLSLKNDRGEYPLWVILTSRGFDGDLPFWQQKDIPRLIVSSKPWESPSSEVDVKVLDSNLPPGQQTLDLLQEQGKERVLLLGGGEVNRTFYTEHLVDELKLTIAPLLIGKGLSRVVNSPLREINRFSLISCEAKDDFIFTHYKRS